MIKNLYKLNLFESDIPVRNMALSELSLSVGRLETSESQDSAAQKSKNLFSCVRMLLRPSTIRLFSAFLLASCFIVCVADGLDSPCRKGRAERS